MELPDLSPMPPAYQERLRQAAAHFEADPRVVAMWVTGAVARHGQDAGSDLDLCLTIEDRHAETFAREHESWIRAVVEPVSIQQMGSTSGWYVLTSSCERIDFLVESEATLASSPGVRRIAVFDKKGCAGRLPAVQDPGPEPQTIAFYVTEALRQMANFPVVIVRRDWLLGVVAVQQLHYFVYELFAQSNRPQPPTGPKQWSSKLSSRHRALLEALPVPQPDRHSVVHAHSAAVDLFEAEAPPIARQAGVEWPRTLHEAVCRYRQRCYPPDW
ncbi:MAG TPA: hypothetical protein VFT75_07415 [Nocardioidaceae bacterium]|nr:hypothetical protein [Nocardioidaceae bacterium]